MAAVAIKMTCNNPKNQFCFVCGIYTKSHHKRSIMTKPLLDAYETYFTVRTEKRNYIHGPPSVCNDCNIALLRWANGVIVKPELAFDVPMIWSEARNHQTDCYFCLTRLVLTNRRTPDTIRGPVEYPGELGSAIKPRSIATNETGPSTGSAARRGRSTTNNAPVASNKSSTVANAPNSVNVPATPVVQHEIRRTVKQIGPVLVAGIKRKSSELPTVGTYDVTKVRLRSSEPSIVLEKSAKPIPAQSIAMSTPSPLRTSLRSATAAANSPKQPNHPQITSVFSLHGPMSSYDDLSPSPTTLVRGVNGHTEMPITIEIDDDDDDEEELQVNHLLKKEELCDDIVELQQDEEQSSASLYQHQLAEAVKEEPVLMEVNEQRVPQPIDEDRKPASMAVEFININSLPSASSTASSKMVVFKMESHKKPNVPTSSELCRVSKNSSKTADPSGMQRVVTTTKPRDPKLITQSELILLLRDLELTREKSAILIDRLKRWNLLAAQLITPTRQRNSATAGEPEPQPKPTPPPVRQVTRLSELSTLGSVTVKQDKSNHTVLLTPTGSEQKMGQSFIRITPGALQSNTVTTSNNTKLVLVNGVPVVPTVFGNVSVKLERPSSSLPAQYTNEQLLPIASTK